MISKDDQLILYANEFHLVTRAHLAALTGRNPKSLNESLRRLVQEKVLYCRTQGLYKPHVYAAYDIARRQQFDHDLPITDIHLALHNTGRLIEWQQARQKRKGEINEDALFYLSVPMPERVGSIKYYLEYDTGTEPLWQIDERLVRYLALRRQSAEPFNVLFVALEKERAAKLARRAEKVLDRENPSRWKLFLFVSLQDILANTLGPICTIAYDEKTYPIIPPLL
jgi:hypothetical protein